MKKPKFKLKGKVWIYPGKAAWHFVNVNKQISKEIRDNFGEAAGGFGSIPVRVTVGKSVWETSIFPDKKTESYLLPVKAKVRKSEEISADEMMNYELEIRL